MSGTCRFCRELVVCGVKYGVRHYAHYSCYLDAGKKLADLHDWQIVEFPWKILRERGLIGAAQDAIAREEVRKGEARAKWGVS